VNFGRLPREISEPPNKKKYVSRKKLRFQKSKNNPEE
jgi:hypothetical protein